MMIEVIYADHSSISCKREVGKRDKVSHFSETGSDKNTSETMRRREISNKIHK